MKKKIALSILAVVAITSVFYVWQSQTGASAVSGTTTAPVVNVTAALSTERVAAQYESSSVNVKAAVQESAVKKADSGQSVTMSLQRKLEPFCDALLSQIKNEKDQKIRAEKLLKESSARQQKIADYLSDYLQSDLNPVRRTAALLLLTEIQTEQVAFPDIGDDTQCANQEACGERYKQNVRAKTQMAAQALIKMATTTNNPDLYAMVYTYCHNLRGTADQSCQLISSRQWARIDPGNGMAWMHVLADLQKSKAAQTDINEVLYQIAHASEFSPRIQAQAELQSELIHQFDDPGMFAELSALHILSQMSTQLMPQNVVASVCRKAASEDDGKKQVCLKIAQNMMEKDQSSILSRRLGESLARQINGADPTLDTYAKDTEVLIAYAVLSSHGNQSSSAEEGSAERMKQQCKNSFVTMNRSMQILSDGEVKYYQQQRRASGLRDEEILAQYRRLREAEKRTTQ